MAMRFLLALIVAVCVCSCTSEDQQRPASRVITLGVLPDQSASGLTARFTPLVAYLESATGLDIALKISSSYEGLLEEFDAGTLDLVNFGGVTFVQAEQRSGAEPLVSRDVDLQFVSCYLVKAAEPRLSVADFHGESFVFGPTLSTSGHVMPRYFLTKDGMVPEQFFSSVHHASAHDDTVKQVFSGSVSIGVANCDILRAMSRDGRLDQDKIRILETTPAYTNYVWAVQESMDAAIRILLRDAFLALDMSKPEHRELLRAQGAGGYLPASTDDLDDVRNAAKIVGLLGGETPR